MLSNVEIQSQIYSLQISNKNTHGQIEEFRSLTFIASEVDAQQLLSQLSMSNLKTLSVLSLNSALAYIHEITLIRHLSVSSFSLNELCQVIRYSPMLQYLNAPNIGQELYDPMPVEICFSGYYAVHLKHLSLATIDNIFITEHGQFPIQICRQLSKSKKLFP